MKNDEFRDLYQLLLDSETAPDERASAARRLSRWDTPIVLRELLRIAQEERVDDLLAYAVGESIADILVRQGRLSEALLENFVGPAYLGFDASATRQLSSPEAYGGQ